LICLALLSQILLNKYCENKDKYNKVQLIRPPSEWTKGGLNSDAVILAIPIKPFTLKS